jgi:hypothetical protein
MALHTYVGKGAESKSKSKSSFLILLALIRKEEKHHSKSGEFRQKFKKTD